MSTSLYTTFGNEIKYRITNDTLETFLENSTIKFVLPEAASEILSELAPVESVDPSTLDTVKTRLESIGFSTPNARAMAAVLIQVAQAQNVSPMVYFDTNEASLKLAVDSYKTINMLRPAGNRINVVSPLKNNRSRYGGLIKP